MRTLSKLRLRALVAILFAWPALAGPVEPSATGTFVMGYPNEAYMLQLVQTPDGTISGQITNVRSGSTGVVESGVGAVTGVFNQGMITLTIGPVRAIGRSVHVTGKIDGDLLSVNAGVFDGKVGTLEFRRADVSEFQKLTDTLIAHATGLANTAKVREQRKQRHKDYQKVLPDADDLVTSVYRIFGAVEDKFGDIKKSQEACQAETTRMQMVFLRIKAAYSQPGSNRADLKAMVRKELKVSDNCYRDALKLRTDFEEVQSEYSPLLAQTHEACKNILAQHEEALASAIAPNWVDACQRIFDATTGFSKTQKRLLTALSEADNKFAQEHARQLEIKAEATQLHLLSQNP